MTSENLIYNPYWICQSSRIGWNTDTTITMMLLISFGVMYGGGLTYLIQSTVSLDARKHLIRAGHFFGGFMWLISVTSCNPLTYALMVSQTYLWGAEPYDNVFSVEMWKVVKKLWIRGEKIHAYWAISSLFVHAWFLSAAASVSIGVERPEWVPLSIVGFVASHIARVFAYDYKDKIASFFEVLGVLILGLCLVIEYFTFETFPMIWLSVSFIERITHIPSAFRGDASWMRSYDLWVAAKERSEDSDNCAVQMA